MIAFDDVAQQAALDRFAADVRERFGDWVIDLVLFGSRARGTAAPWSDWDVLAVTDHRDRIREADVIDLAVGYLLSDRLNLSIKFMTCEVRDLQRRLGAPFLRKVVRDGRSLWTRPTS